MMSHIRRHQRTITILVTACTISTFVFFGSSRAFAPTNAAHEVIAWQVGKTQLSVKQLQTRSRFLGSELATSAQSNETWCSWLNPGFVSQWILSTGLGAQMIDSNPVFKAALEERKGKELKWQGYRHPYMGHLNYDSVLSQFNPPLAQALKKWRMESELSAKAKIDLYQQAKRMPTEFFTTIIRYHEASLSAAQKDPSLDGRSMSLFGYESMQAWFGKEFVDSCVKLISLGAQHARSLGYDVSLAQARHSVHSRIEQVWSGLKEKGVDLSLPAFKAQMYRSVGMSEQELTEFWQELVLFECFFHHQGSQALTDPLAINHLAAFAGESRQAEVYEIPALYRCSNLEALAKLQVYWHYTTGLALTDPSVPLHKKSTEEISKVCPELIANRVSLEWRHLTLDDFRLRVGPKKMIVWQAEDDLWAQISPQVTQKNITERAERIKLLSLLDRTKREHVDQASLKWILKHNPERCLSLIEEVPAQNDSLVFALASAKQPLEGISNANLLLQYLKSGEPKLYTQDEQHYYLFSKAHAATQELIDFQKAQELSILDALLLKKLTAHYETMKSRQSPALYKDGKLLELSKVRSQILMDLLQPVLVELQRQMANYTQQAPKAQIYKVNEANEVASWRYVSMLQNVAGLESMDTDQAPAWAPVKTTRFYTRSDVAQTPLSQLFDVAQGEWTSPEAKSLMLYQKAKLLQIIPVGKAPSESMWAIVDQAQTTLDHAISEQYLQKWATVHEKEWAPLQQVESSEEVSSR